ncbi:carbonic anhydrase [Niabella ginsenosidivorans]|uniref:Carbonic anhydrase n=1 Tax=Niabella ginsenosidivorans TaxID=1176587 RepID=A0A1A9HXL5_9BACT|nr:carbonic anhydrase [Niabella ginsenosidivorans]ANH79983.1 carbonic anhydrase [Niabella ginsenosidivorans]
MKSYEKLLANNKEWAAQKLKVNNHFFDNLAESQSPEFLWIGCSDSRVPANEITGTTSGEIFVHRNIANLVVHTDINLISVLEYAVAHLKVKHVIVCGHYGCGGVKAALSNDDFHQVLNMWLREIKDVYYKNKEELELIKDEKDRLNRMVELNVKEQVEKLAKTSIIQKAWKERGAPVLHGWVYGLADGQLHPLHTIQPNTTTIDPIYIYDDLK